MIDRVLAHYETPSPLAEWNPALKAAVDNAARHPVADFSGWKDPEVFETAFAQLLDDLRGDQE